MYTLESRFIGSPWEPCEDINSPFTDLQRAIKRARKLSESASVYGAVRVVDKRGEVYATFVEGTAV